MVVGREVVVGLGVVGAVSKRKCIWHQVEMGTRKHSKYHPRSFHFCWPLLVHWPGPSAAAEVLAYISVLFGLSVTL